jgi:hypothetical protein
VPVEITRRLFFGVKEFKYSIDLERKNFLLSIKKYCVSMNGYT